MLLKHYQTFHTHTKYEERLHSMVCMWIVCVFFITDCQRDEIGKIVSVCGLWIILRYFLDVTIHASNSISNNFEDMMCVEHEYTQVYLDEEFFKHLAYTPNLN